jgi:hypothetical protein
VITLATALLVDAAELLLLGARVVLDAARDLDERARYRERAALRYVTREVATERAERAHRFAMCAQCGAMAYRALTARGAAWACNGPCRAPVRVTWEKR